MDIEKERCPICWLDFSSDLHPHLASCGHSFCKHCYDGLKVCAMCKFRFRSKSSKPKNYSLLSLVEKLERATKERKEQHTQTEEASGSVALVPLNASVPMSPSQLTPMKANFMKDLAGNIQGISFTFV